MPTKDDNGSNGNIVDMFTREQLEASEVQQEEAEDVINNFLGLATHFVDTAPVDPNNDGTALTSNMRSYVVVAVDKQGMLSMSSAGVAPQDIIGQLELAKQFIIMDHMKAEE